MPTVSKNNKQNYSRALFIRSLKHVDPSVINAPGAGVYQVPISSAGNDPYARSVQTEQRLQADVSLTLLRPGPRFPPGAALSTVIEADKQVDTAATLQYSLELQPT